MKNNQYVDENKQPSIPLDIAYKVVVVGPDGRMWSPNYHYINHNGSGRHSRVVQYKLRNMVKPNRDVPVLFVCSTKEDGQNALKFYQDNDVRAYLLRGYAVGLKEVNNDTIGNEITSRGGLPGRFSFRIPKETVFASCICDFFIPIGIVAKQDAGQILQENYKI